MENLDIINFSKFFEGNYTQKINDFKKEDFQDFFINEEINETKEEEVAYPTTKVKQEEPKVQEPFNPPVKPKQFVIEEEEPEDLDIEDSLPDPKYALKENVADSNFYSVYKDKPENFSCDVLVEGASISDTKARLILESDDWTLMFEGDIDRYGKCTIPIKKLNILNEGLVGKIRLEVIADNTVFTPWEDDFKVKLSKKVLVQVHESKQNTPKKPLNNNSSNVRVNVRR
jgi:hypothetical protein